MTSRTDSGLPKYVHSQPPFHRIAFCTCEGAFYPFGPFTIHVLTVLQQGQPSGYE